MDVLFWSGGKDSYLALEFYRKESSNRKVALLTTYDEENDIVPHQQIPLQKIKKQAEHLGLNIHTVPLPEECPNEVYLKKIDEALSQSREQSERLLFGDWHLKDIRNWRELSFKNYECCFPIWKKSLHKLLPVLLLKAVEVRISAVQKPFQKHIKIGELYNQHFVEQLPDEIDPMGERGEFHTEVIFRSG